MNDSEIIQKAIREDNRERHAAGVYWYGAQNGKLLFRDQKNVAVGNFYSMLAALLNAANNTTGFVLLSGSEYIETVFTTRFLAGISGNITGSATPNALATANAGTLLAVGTDTTTRTTQSAVTLTNFVTQSVASSISANTNGYITIIATFGIGALGGGTTTTIGEIGLLWGWYPNGKQAPMLSRIAVADGADLGNGSGAPVIIQNAYACTFTVVIYL